MGQAARSLRIHLDRSPWDRPEAKGSSAVADEIRHRMRSTHVWYEEIDVHSYIVTAISGGACAVLLHQHGALKTFVTLGLHTSVICVCIFAEYVML